MSSTIYLFFPKTFCRIQMSYSAGLVYKERGYNVTAGVIMGRPKTEGVELEGVKIEKAVLDKARVSLTHVKTKDAKGKGYTLGKYISECLMGLRSLVDDHSAYIREESKKLGKH